MAIVIAGLGVLLAVPIAVTPQEIPLPVVDGAALSTTLEHDRTRAGELATTLSRELERESGAGLYDLRALGQSLRAYGKAESGGDTYEVVRARQALQENVGRARAEGDERLLALRAYEGVQFARELARYENTGLQSDELIGLAGPFIALMSRYGWIHERVVGMDDALRSTFWKRRWNEVTGMTEGVFALTVDEQRVFYAFLLQHPVLDGSVRDANTSRRARAEWLLRKVDELGHLDPAYPLLLARGVLLYRLERYAPSAEALRAHLLSGADPPYALRARNYLAAALVHDQQP